MNVRDRLSEGWARISDMVRLFVVTTTSPLLWGITGFSDGTETETDELQVYQTCGFLSRPEAGANVEAIAVNVNGGDHHVIVACRDDAAVRRVVEALGLGHGVAHVYNGTNALSVTPDGIEAKSLTGTAVALATLEDLNALRDWIQTTMVLPVSGAAAGPLGPPPALQAPIANGTSVLKGE